MVTPFKKPMEPRVRTTRPRGFQLGGPVRPRQQPFVRTGLSTAAEDRAQPPPTGNLVTQRPAGWVSGGYDWGQSAPHAARASQSTQRGEGVFSAGESPPTRTGTLRRDSSARERERQQRQYGQSMGWSVRSPMQSSPPSGFLLPKGIDPHPLGEGRGGDELRTQAEVADIYTKTPYASGLASQEWMAQGGRVYDRNQPGYAVGGLITPDRPEFKQKNEGMGTLMRPQPPSTDTVSAVLTPGEHVIDARNAEYIRRNPADLSNLQRVAGDIQRGSPSVAPSPLGGVAAKPGSPSASPQFNFEGQAPKTQYSWLSDAAQGAVDYVSRKAGQLGDYVSDTASSGYGVFGDAGPDEGTPDNYRGALNDPNRWSEDPIPAGVNPATGSWNSTVYGDLNGRANEIARNIFGEANPDEIAAILAVLQAGYDVAPDGTVFFARRDDRNFWIFHNIGSLQSNPIYSRIKGEQLESEEKTEQEKTDAAIEAGRQDRLVTAQKGVEAARGRGADIIRRSAELAAKNKARAAGQATRSAFMAMATRPGEAGLAQAADVRQMGILAGASEQLIGELEAEKMLLMAELQKIDVEMGNINERIQFEREDNLRDQYSREQQHLQNQKMAYQASMADIEAQIAKAMEPGWWDKWGGQILGTAGTIVGAYFGGSGGAAAGGAAGHALGEVTGTAFDKSTGRLIAPGGQSYYQGPGGGFYDANAADTRYR